MRCRYRIKGPFEGRSGHFGHFQFVDGLTPFADRPEQDWEKLDRQQVRFHQCIREHEGDNDVGVEVPRDRKVQLNGSQPPEETTDVSDLDADPEEGSAWSAATEDSGQERTTALLSLKDALDSLDASQDEHWTPGGMPKVAYLRAITGQKILRAEIDSAASWLTRGYLAAHSAENQ